MADYRVLIVDDQRDVRRMLASGLHTLGHKLDVVEVPSAEEALIVASHKDLDLIVCDVRLPGISGLELVKKIQRLHPELKIIMITGLADPKVRQEVQEVGAEAFFFKPVEISTFLKTVENCLGIPPEEPSSVPASISPAREAIAVPMPAPLSPQLGHLARLRKNLGALAAVVIDSEGKILHQDGGFTELERPELAAALVTAWQASQHVAQQLRSQAAQNFLLFDGGAYRLCLVPLRQATALLLVVDRPLAEEAGLVFSQMQATAADLRQEMEKAGLEENEVSSKPRVVADEGRRIEEDLDKVQVTAEDLAVVDAIIEGKKTLDTDELNAFWENVAEEDQPPKTGDEGGLSYDQAHDLGLVKD